MTEGNASACGHTYVYVFAMHMCVCVYVFAISGAALFECQCTMSVFKAYQTHTVATLYRVLCKETLAIQWHTFRA